MHYYQFNIADYRKDTAHLSPIEHYIYRQLLDWYYLDESQIPKETQSVMRRLSLGSDMEPKLNNVLTDFFVETKNGWKHARVEREIAAYRAMAERNAVNGGKGGRPKKSDGYLPPKKNKKAKKTQSVTTGNPNESEKKPNQEPRTNNQEPIKSKDSCAEPASRSAPAVIAISLNDGSEHGITQAKIDEWATLFPAVSVIAELRKMRAWSIENPKKRKTRNGIGRFIVAWLGREQDRGGSNGAQQQDGRGRRQSLAERATAARIEAERVIDEREASSSEREIDGELVGEDDAPIRPQVDIGNG